MKEGGRPKGYFDAVSRYRVTCEDAGRYTFFEKVDDKKFDAKIAELRQLKEDNKESPEGGTPDYLIASRIHEEVSMRKGIFDSYLGNQSRERFGKEAEELTRAEVREIYDGWDGKEELEQLESGAIDAYEVAASEPFELLYDDQNDATLARLDLLWRKANRETDDAIRLREVEEIERAYWALAKQVEDYGKRAEYEFINLMRVWIRKQGLGHVLSAEHTSPKDDKRYGTDLKLVFGDRRYQISQKTWTDDSNIRKWQAAERAKAEEKVAGVHNGKVVIFMAYDMKGAVMKNAEGKQGREKGKLLDTLIGSIPEEAALLERLKGKKKEVKEGKMTKKDVESYFSNIQNLVDLRLLSKEDSDDMSKILHVQRIVKEIGPRVIKTEADLKDEGKIEEIRKALE